MESIALGAVFKTAALIYKGVEQAIVYKKVCDDFGAFLRLIEALLRGPLLHEEAELIQQPGVVEGLKLLARRLDEALDLVRKCQSKGRMYLMFRDIRASFKECEGEISKVIAAFNLPILHLQLQNKKNDAGPSHGPEAAMKTTSQICSANSLAIVWGMDDRYWRWRTLEGSRSAQVAYLREVCWLDVFGQMRCHLWPGFYTLSWRLHLDKEASGWDSDPVHFEFSTSDGQRAKCASYLTAAGTQDFTSVTTVAQRWRHYPVGQFEVSPSHQGVLEVNFSMKEQHGLWKRGLFIDAVLIHASPQSGLQSEVWPRSGSDQSTLNVPHLHRHPLKFEESPSLSYNCASCATPGSGNGYSCEACDFVIHPECGQLATLERNLENEVRDDSQSLIRFSSAEDTYYAYEASLKDEADVEPEDTSSGQASAGAGDEDTGFLLTRDQGAAFAQVAWNRTSPTLHKLFQIKEDQLGLSFVEKITVPAEDLFNLCNLLTPGSAVCSDDRFVVDFDALNRSQRRVVGLYGCKEALTDVLRSLCVLDKTTERQVKDNTLAPEIYGVLSVEILYVFYWHPGSRMEPPSRKDVSCNFIRYVLDLCDTVYVCLDPKVLEAFLTASVSTAVARSMRVQKRAITHVKPSKDNVELRTPGYDICPPAMDADSNGLKTLVGGSAQDLDLGPRLSEGLQRCGVLTPTACPPSKVYGTETVITAKVGQLSQQVEELSKSHIIGITELPNQELILLLEWTQLPERQDYLVHKGSCESRRAEVKDGFYNSPEALERAGKRIVSVFNKALSICLQEKYPWEATTLGGEFIQNPQQSADILKFGDAYKEQDMIRLEGELCKIWMDFLDVVKGDAEPLCLLFVGSEISVVKGKGSDEVFVIQGDASQTGPILYGQEFTALSTKTKQAKRFTLLPEHSGFPSIGPVMLGTSQFLPFVYSEKKNQHQVNCRKPKSDGRGMMKWIQSYLLQINPLPRDLQRKADILSYLIQTGAGTPDSEEILETVKQVVRSTDPGPAGYFGSAFPDQRIENFELKHNLASIGIRRPDGSHQADVRSACTAVYKDALKTFEAHIRDQLVTTTILPWLEAKMRSKQESNHQSVEPTLKRLESDLLQKLRDKNKQAQVDHPDQCILQVTRCRLVEKSVFKKVASSLQWGDRPEAEIKVHYRSEETQHQRVSWHMTELTPSQKDVDRTTRYKKHMIVPRCLTQYEYELIALDPNSERLMKVVTVETGETLIFVENTKKRHCSLYIRCKRGGTTLVTEFKRGFDLIAFDEHSRFLAMYDRSFGKIVIYKFDDSFRYLDHCSDGLLEKYTGSQDLTHMMFIPGRRELVLIDTDNRIRVLELSHDSESMIKAGGIPLLGAATHARITTKGACLLVFSKVLSSFQDSQPPSQTAAIPQSLLDGAGPQVLVQDGHLQMDVYLLNDRVSFLKTIQLDDFAPGDVASIEITVTSFGPQMQLLVLEGARPNRGIHSNVLEITCTTQALELQPVTRGKGKQLVPGVRSSAAEHTENGAICPELDYISLVFEKFSASPPLLRVKRDLFVHLLLRSKAKKDDLQGRCAAYVKSAWDKIKWETGKDFTDLPIHLMTGVLDKYLGTNKLLEGTHVDSRNVAALGDWIRRLVCLVPIQLARAEYNSLRPLRDGLQIPADMPYDSAVSLSQVIRFGFYDAVLSYWRGPVKVVSSMGKQSSGKSYLLNHLSGSLLDVAGGRCTDGVWMTMRHTETCLYVILDFEGLGSFERSEQEDMLLSILNAAVSNITIFNKKDFHLDKETEAVFARFESGISLVKEDSRLFKGVFYMAIKDVAEPDIEELTDEFWRKIEQICQKSKEGNFLTKMYGSVPMVAALPPFQSRDFHKSISDLAETVREETEAVFHNGRTFATDLTLIIAGISAKDWSGMDTKRIALRIANMKRHLRTAIFLGRLNRQVDNDLINFETQEVVADNPVQLDEHHFTDRDTCLELSPYQESQVMGSILQSLQERFEAVVKRIGCKDEIWHTGFEKFLSAVGKRREERVLQWLDCNTEEFKTDSDVLKLRTETETMLGDMRQRLSLCNHKCQHCILLCVFEKSHPPGSKHTCGARGSVHSCWQTCQYCEDASNACGYKNGHEGPHVCRVIKHTCGMDCCKLEISSNCNRVCHKKPDHEGDHLCNIGMHKCSVKCDLASCKNMCTNDLGHQDRHICQEQNLCPRDCVMPGCFRRCKSDDHFHAEKTDSHLCGNEHRCLEKCEARGMCQIVTDIRNKRKNTFVGKRGEFKFIYLSEQNGIKKECCKPIPAGQQIHEGEHTHTNDADAVHLCEARCKACGYFCDLAIDHPGLHETRHGNMRGLYFAAESEEIDILDRKYVWGESGIAEMCMMHCKAQGRGHIHLIGCGGQALPSSSGKSCSIHMLEGARHQTQSYGPDHDVPKDELTHSAYWQYLKFKDPCPDVEFGVCAHFCKSQEHAPQERSYCTEKIWHSPVLTLPAGARSGYLTEDGHFLPCNHDSNLSHIIFVIDRSSSMSQTDFRPSMKKFTGPEHNNRLGSVYEAMVRFINKRPAFGGKDSVSIILFSGEATVALERQILDESIVDNLLSYSTDRGTQYRKGLELAAEVLQRALQDATLSNKSPVIILLGDGRDWGGSARRPEDEDQKCLEVVTKMKEVNPNLVLHTIFCGNRRAGRDLLKQLAEAGGGRFAGNITDDVALAETFENLACTLRPLVASTLIPFSMP